MIQIRGTMRTNYYTVICESVIVGEIKKLRDAWHLKFEKKYGAADHRITFEGLADAMAEAQRVAMLHD